MQVPTPSNPNPDGACSPPACDVGSVPIGEYLYDHRNGTMLRDFLINDVILGPNGLGNAGACVRACVRGATRLRHRGSAALPGGR